MTTQRGSVRWLILVGLTVVGVSVALAARGERKPAGNAGPRRFAGSTTVIDAVAPRAAGSSPHSARSYATGASRIHSSTPRLHLDRWRLASLTGRMCARSRRVISLRVIAGGRHPSTHASASPARGDDVPAVRGQALSDGRHRHHGCALSRSATAPRGLTGASRVDPSKARHRLLTSRPLCAATTFRRERLESTGSTRAPSRGRDASLGVRLATSCRGVSW